MINSQTIISIKRDKVSELRELNRQIPNFFKSFINFYSISNYPLYLSDSIFVSHSEQSNITTCHIITPYLGSSLTNIFHKVYDQKDDEIEWYDSKKIINNLIMGFKGVFEVNNPEKLEIEAEFATSKNSVYSVFGLIDKHFLDFSAKDFDDILDLVEFKEKDKNKELKNIENLHKGINYMGSFAQRQACLAYQADGLFKAFPFKSNKTINLDTDELHLEFREEAKKLNQRFEFVSEQQQEEILMKYVASHDFKEKLSNRLFESFINGIKGEAKRVEPDL